MKSVLPFFLGMVLMATARTAVITPLDSVVATGGAGGQTTAVVPEPAAALLGALGVLTLLRRRRVGC